MIHARRLILALLLLLTLVAQVGCVALNIPSQRVHDPDDQGGLLGHWPATDAHGPRWLNAIGVDDVHVHRGGGQPAQSLPSLAPATTPCVSWEGSDDFDPLAVDMPRGKSEEVPWPRFHPVPTRPVFGAADDASLAPSFNRYP